MKNMPTKGVSMSTTNLGNHLQKLFTDVALTKNLKDFIDGNLGKVEEKLATKISEIYTVSDYYNNIWNHKNLTEEDRNLAIGYSEALHMKTCEKIVKHAIPFSETAKTTDVILTEYNDLTEYEEHLYKEKSKDYTKKSEGKNHRIPPFSISDPDLMRSVNDFRGLSSSMPDTSMHYASGIIDEGDEIEEQKIKKAKIFVRGIKKKTEFAHKRVIETQERQDTAENMRIEMILDSQRREKDILLQKRKKDIESHMKRLSDRRKMREESARSQSQDIRRNIPLYELMSQRYKKNIELPMIQEIERKLQAMKNRKPPIPKGIFAKWSQEHDDKLDEYAKNHPKKPTEEDIEVDRSQVSKYYKTAEVEITDFKKSYQRELKQKKEKKRRILDYDKTVKEEHPVTVKRELTPPQEEEVVIPTPKKSNLKLEEAKDPNYKKTLGLLYLRQAKTKTRAKTQEPSPQSKQITETAPQKTEYGLNLDPKKLTATEKNSDASQSQSTMNTTRKDYLASLRQAGVMRSRVDALDDVITNRRKLDPHRKKELLIHQKNKLDNMIERHFELKKMGKKHDNIVKSVDADGEIDGYLVGAIKTKLAILDDIC